MGDQQKALNEVMEIVDKCIPWRGSGKEALSVQLANDVEASLDGDLPERLHIVWDPFDLKLAYYNGPRAREPISLPVYRGYDEWTWMIQEGGACLKEIGRLLKRAESLDYGLVEAFVNHHQLNAIVLEEGEEDCGRNVWRLVEALMAEQAHPRLKESKRKLTPHIHWEKPDGDHEGERL